jgi:hypothetical protein
VKYLDLCQRVLSRQQIRQEELAEFVIDYCTSKGKPEIVNHISEVMQLIMMGSFNLNHIISEYVKDHNKQLCTLSKDGVLIKQWIE